jgi:hypothetical protein
VPRPSRKGNAYTEEACIDAWSACRADLGRAPTKKDYKAWRTRRMQEAGLDLPNYATLMHHLGEGSWTGISERFGVHVPPARGRKRRFSDEQLRAAWTRCRRELGRPPTVTDYLRWRKACICRGEQPPPAAKTLIRRLGAGAWRGGKLADTDSHSFDRARWRLSDRELVGASRACAADLGRAPTRFDYDVWRRGEIDRGRARPPDAGTIALRLGGRSWPAAVRLAAHRSGGWQRRIIEQGRNRRGRRRSSEPSGRPRLSCAVRGAVREHR